MMLSDQRFAVFCFPPQVAGARANQGQRATLCLGCGVCCSKEVGGEGDEAGKTARVEREEETSVGCWAPRKGLEGQLTSKALVQRSPGDVTNPAALGDPKVGVEAEACVGWQCVGTG